MKRVGPPHHCNEALRSLTTRLTPQRPNVSHAKLVAALDGKFTAGTGVKAIEALVAANKINRGAMKIGKVNYVWYWLPTASEDPRQKVLKLVVSCAKRAKAPDGCVVSNKMRLFGFYRDVLCAEVVAAVLAARPRYAHELCELLIELGVLPSSIRLRRLYRHLKITIDKILLLSYGTEPAGIRDRRVLRETLADKSAHRRSESEDKAAMTRGCPQQHCAEALRSLTTRLTPQRLSKPTTSQPLPRKRGVSKSSCSTLSCCLRRNLS